MYEFRIIPCSIIDAYRTSLQIPEFEPWYPWEQWHERLKDKHVIALLAKDGSVNAGFKVGYYEDHQFYSWVGGVLPVYRRMGVARMLAEEQERLVSESGIHLIRMKTRNRFKEMLLFALSRDFYITDVEQTGDPLDWRITLYKNV